MGARMGTVCYPNAGREVDEWADRLTAYPGGGLERALEAHRQELFADGLTVRRESTASGEAVEEWSERPRRRQRWSTEAAAATVRKQIMRLVPLREPPHTVGPMVAVEVGALEACASLFFHPETDEAWRESLLTLVSLDGKYRRKPDPLRPRFRNAGQVLERAIQPATQRRLGAGPQSYAIAESKGRTRARWDEIHCAGSHVGSGSVKGMAAVELAVDAQRSVLRAGIDEVDAAGLVDWLRNGLKREERVRQYRRREAIRWGAGVMGIVSDAAAAEATAHLSDKAILERLTRARAQLERHLAKLPGKAEALAFASGDRSFLAPLAAKREERKQKSPPVRVERVALDAPGCM